MRWLTAILCLGLWGQVRVRIGHTFTAGTGIGGVDTVFRLQKAPLYLWVEARFLSPVEWDTLWVALRTVDRIQGAYLLIRTKTDRNLYRGRVVFRQSGIYLLTFIPPRQVRLVLGRSKVYITDADYPTVAALRARARGLASASPTNPEAGLTVIDTVALEALPLPEEALSPLEANAPALEEPLEEDLDSLLEVPDEEIVPEEDLDLEELDFGDDL